MILEGARVCRGLAAGDEAAVRELEGEELQRWETSRGALEALELSEEEAEKVLKRAFGWTTQAWWRDSKVCEVPAEGQVRPLCCREEPGPRDGLDHEGFRLRALLDIAGGVAVN